MNSKLFILVKIIIVIIISETYEIEQCSFNDLNQVKKDENFYILKSFDKFSDLKFNCSQSINISMLGLKPDTKIILDKSLNFTGLVINPTQTHFAMLLHNLKGFSVNSNPFRVIKKSNKFNKAYLIFSIDQTNFDFFDDQNIPIKCESSVIKTKENLFTGTILSIGYDTKLKLNTCPLIFSNINLGIIDLRLSSSFIDKNILGFQQNQDFKSLNSTIYHVKLMLYHTKTDPRLPKVLRVSMLFLDFPVRFEHNFLKGAPLQHPVEWAPLPLGSE